MTRYAALALSVCATLWVAQGPVNPTTAKFTASAHHDAVDAATSLAIVTSYVVELYAQDGVTLKTARDIGKPTPDAFNEITYTQLASMLTPLPDGVYVARVAAVGPGGVARSGLSNDFAVDLVTNLPPPAMRSIRIVPIVVTPPPPGGVAHDDFDRPDGALGINWLVALGSPLVVRSGEAAALTEQFNVAVWAAPLPGDQFSEATVKTQVAYSGLVVRTGYLWTFNMGNDGRVYRNDGGSFTQVMAGLPQPPNGATARFEAVGTTLRVLINGAVVGTATDGVHRTGAVGVMLYGDGRVDGWRGGSL